MGYCFCCGALIRSTAALVASAPILEQTTNQAFCACQLQIVSPVPLVFAMSRSLSRLPRRFQSCNTKVYSDLCGPQ